MLEHYLAIAFIVFVEHDAGMRGANELRQLALAVLDRPAPQILTPSSIRSKAQSTASSPWRARRTGSNTARPLWSVTIDQQAIRLGTRYTEMAPDRFKNFWKD